MIVVTGATGNVGRPLTQALAEAGEQVTAVSRHAAAVPDGVRHVAADLTDPASLSPALDGAKALFFLLSGDLHSPAPGRPTSSTWPPPPGWAGSSCCLRRAWRPGRSDPRGSLCARWRTR